MTKTENCYWSIETNDVKKGPERTNQNRFHNVATALTSFFGIIGRRVASDKSAQK